MIKQTTRSLPQATRYRSILDSRPFTLILILKGPVTAWLKKVDDATQNPSAAPGDGWFKIAEAGLISPSKFEKRPNRLILSS